MPKLFDYEETDPKTQESKMKQGLFSKLGTMLTYTAVGLKDPGRLAEIQAQNTRAEQEFEMFRQKMEMQRQIAQAKQNPTPVYGVSPSTNSISRIGSVPSGAKVVNIPLSPEQKAKEVMIKDATVRGNKLNELNKVIDFFESKINEIPSGKGIGGRIKGVGLTMEGMLQTNPDVAAYQANLEGLRSQIARGLGEVGNLAETEQKYAAKLLPSVSDNTETRAKKMANFRKYIETKLGDKSSSISNKTTLTKDNLFEGL